MKYPATLTRSEEDDEGIYVVRFRDIPEAITQGRGKGGATLMAEDALMTALDFYFEDNRLIPMPSLPQEGEVMINLPASAFIKVLLLNTMLEERVTQSMLAKRMGVKPQQVTRLVNLKHTTKIDNLACAFKALGRELIINVA